MSLQQKLQSYLLPEYGPKTTGAARRRRNSISYVPDISADDIADSPWGKPTVAHTQGTRKPLNATEPPKRRSRRHSIQEFQQDEAQARETAKREQQNRGAMEDKYTSLAEPVDPEEIDGESLQDNIDAFMSQDPALRDLVREKRRRFQSLAHQLVDELVPVFLQETQQPETRNTELDAAIAEEQANIEKLKKSIRVNQYRNQTLEKDATQLPEVLGKLLEEVERTERPYYQELEQLQEHQREIEKCLGRFEEYSSSNDFSKIGSKNKQSGGEVPSPIETVFRKMADSAMFTQYDELRNSDSADSGIRQNEQELDAEKREQARLDRNADEYIHRLISNFRLNTANLSPTGNGDPRQLNNSTGGVAVTPIKRLERSDWEDVIDAGDRKRIESLHEEFQVRKAEDELKQSFECISDEKTACKAVELLLQEDEMTMNVAKVKNDVSTVHQIQLGYTNEAERLQTVREYSQVLADLNDISKTIKRHWKSGNFELSLKTQNELKSRAQSLAARAREMEEAYKSKHDRLLYEDLFK